MTATKPLLAAGSALVLMFSLAQGAAAQDDIPRMPNGKPDFNGIWEFPYVPDMSGPGNGRNQIGAGEIKFTEAGRLNFERYDASEGDYTGACLPFGHVRSMNSPNPVQFFQNDTQFAYLFEVNTWHHAFPIGGEDKTMDLPPTWYGNSHAVWDGDTLVVTTLGQHEQTWLDRAGNHHSNQLRVTERFTLIDKDHMQYEATLEDPLTYSAPWTIEMVLYRNVDKNAQLFEHKCVPFADKLLYSDLMGLE